MRDLLVAGGGPVGLATALHARAAGLSVTVVEPRRAPVDKACGEGLMPSAVAQLRRLGVEVEGRPFAGIRYLAPGASAEGRFRSGPGRGVRRTDLHAALLDRAQAAGVELVTGRVTDVAQRDDEVHAGGLRARWLVGADGLHSSVRRAVGLSPRMPAPRARFGQRRHYGTAPWTDLVEVYWGAGAEAYVTPVGPGTVGVAVLSRRGPAFDELLASFAPLRERLGEAPALGPVLGAGPLRQDVPGRRRGRVLLVGDAAGYVDALTGEGLSTGLATADAAVRAIAAGRPEDYEQAWRRATRRYRVLTTALLTAAEVPAVRRRLVPLAGRLPGVFGRAVDLLA